MQAAPDNDVPDEPVSGGEMRVPLDTASTAVSPSDPSVVLGRPAMGASAACAVGDIYVRSGPGMQHRPLGYVPAGGIVTMGTSDAQGWARVRYARVATESGEQVLSDGFIYSRSPALEEWYDDTSSAASTEPPD